MKVEEAVAEFIGDKYMQFFCNLDLIVTCFGEYTLHVTKFVHRHIVICLYEYALHEFNTFVQDNLCVMY